MGEDGTFRLWVLGCSHVGTDLRHGRTSLADAIRQAEVGGQEGGPPFSWDIALRLGDLSGSQTPPDDDEGRQVVRQFGVSARHRRAGFYNLVGNLLFLMRSDRNDGGPPVGRGSAAAIPPAPSRDGPSTSTPTTRAAGAPTWSASGGSPSSTAPRPRGITPDGRRCP